jgi:hypothetical protein
MTAPSDSHKPASLAALPCKRRGPRIPIRVPGLLSWFEGKTERTESVSTLSISRFGCSLVSRMFFEPGSIVRLEFAAKSIRGRVVYCLKDHSTRKVTVGISFDHDARDFWQLGLELGLLLS